MSGFAMATAVIDSPTRFPELVMTHRWFEVLRGHCHEDLEHSAVSCLVAKSYPGKYLVALQG